MGPPIIVNVKVAVVCPYSLGFPGGVQTQVVALTIAMRASGITVDLYAPCDDLVPPYQMICLGPSLRLKANGSVAPTGLRPRRCTGYSNTCEIMIMTSSTSTSHWRPDLHS